MTRQIAAAKEAATKRMDKQRRSRGRRMRKTPSITFKNPFKRRSTSRRTSKKLLFSTISPGSTPTSIKITSPNGPDINNVTSNVPVIKIENGTYPNCPCRGVCFATMSSSGGSSTATRTNVLWVSDALHVQVRMTTPQMMMVRSSVGR